ncbi:head-tail connector protein [Clostridium intestinale]|uniref:Phage gp6-like head-tail connector protein n=1 Tax=Clostridium intestinale TaxID=36845 RepID=A0A7D6VT48_9CLOT|nr:head-tail connector protein [Clostridium intestinale]QLY82236.1 phage gp6-like head-tail connector protein [Clostridium intestinale]
MIITIPQVKSWLKIDFDEDNEDIQMLIDAAELYLKNATEKDYDSTNPLAVLYCRVLVTDWYENRSLMQDNKTSDKVRFTLQSIKMQLQYS